MNGLSGLWRNECFKIYRQTANRVIIIIALALAILTPCFNLLVNGATDFFDEEYDNREYWQENADLDLESENYVSYSDWMSRIDAQTFFDDLSIPNTSWKYQAFYEQYRQLLFRRRCFEFYIDGKITKEEFTEQFYWTYNGSDADELPVEFYGDANTVYEKPADIEQPADIDPKWADSFDAEAELVQLGLDVTDTENMLKNLTVKDFANSQLLIYQAELAEKKTSLGELNDQLEKGSATEIDVLAAQLEVEGAEYMVSFYKNMAQTTVPEEDSDWLVNTAAIIGSSACSSLTNVPVSEDEFYNGTTNSLTYGTEDYEEYCEHIENNRANARRALKTADYAIENGIALPEMTIHSAKTLARDSLASVASIIIIALIIVTANNIALEYSSGTIRLLLIRPRKRSKIILSKFCALFTTGVIVSLAVFIVVIVVSIILNGAVYGVWDMFTSDLICFSSVIKISSLLYSLAKLFLPLLSGLFLLSLAFMMAVVTRKAALAIIAPIVVNSMGSIIQMFAMNYAGKYPVLKFTILPYLDLGPYLVSPVSNFATTDLNLTSLVNGMYGSLALNSGLSALTGAIVILIHAGLLFALGFIAFRKQQIKN